MVPVGLSQFASVAPKYLWPDFESIVQKRQDGLDGSPAPSSSGGYEEILNIREEDLEGIYVQALGVEILQQNEDGKRYAASEGQSQRDEDFERLRASRYRGPSESHLGSLVQETNRVLMQTAKENLTSVKDKSKPDFLQSSFVRNPVEAANTAAGPTFVAEPHFSDTDVTAHPKVIPKEKLDLRVDPVISQPQQQAIPKVVIKPLSKKKPVSVRLCVDCW